MTQVIRLFQYGLLLRIKLRLNHYLKKSTTYFCLMKEFKIQWQFKKINKAKEDNHLKILYYIKQYSFFFQRNNIGLIKHALILNIESKNES